MLGVVGHNVCSTDTQAILRVKPYRGIMSATTDTAIKATAPSPSKPNWWRFKLVWEINVGSVGVALLGITLATIIGLKRIDSAQKAVTGEIQNVERAVVGQQFNITDPAVGTKVNLTDIVRGKTPFADENTYLIITPLATGDDYVQDG